MTAAEGISPSCPAIFFEMLARERMVYQKVFKMKTF